MIKLVNLKFIFLVVVVLVILHISIISSQKLAPERVFVYVQTPDGEYDRTAFCFGDVFKDKSLFIDHKPLEKIEKLSDIIDTKKWDIPGDYGYYSFEPNLGSYGGDYEIRIVCTGNKGRTIGYTIINNTHVPCEVKDRGFLIC